MKYRDLERMGQYGNTADAFFIDLNDLKESLHIILMMIVFVTLSRVKTNDHKRKDI